MTLRMDWPRWTLTGRVSAKAITHSKCTLMRSLMCMAGDITLCLFFTASSYVLFSWHLMEPVHRGFNCDDLSIRNPLQPNTVSTPVLLLMTLGAPFAVVVIGNYLATFGTHLEHLETLVSVIHASTFSYLDYVLSYWLTTLFLDVVKCSVGRLRPNFVSMCQADLSGCSSTNRYITDTTCAADWKKARNSRMSFPSGHAAASVFAFLFTVYYFQQLHAHKSHLNRYLNVFRALVVTFFATFTVYCCYTRITDYWHFPTDVLGGVLIASVGFYLFSRKYKPVTKFH